MTGKLVEENTLSVHLNFQTNIFNMKLVECYMGATTHPSVAKEEFPKDIFF